MVAGENYIKEKQHNNNICDMFLSALCNVMSMKAVVIRETNDNCHANDILPSRAGVVPKTTIHLVLTGSGANVHYSGASCKDNLLTTTATPASESCINMKEESCASVKPSNPGKGTTEYSMESTPILKTKIFFSTFSQPPPKGTNT